MRSCFWSGKFCDAEEPERDTGEGREEWPPWASLDRCLEVMEVGRLRVNTWEVDRSGTIL